ncbi:hypothetical protein [Jatrophihabitans lederbergiae]|uniref:Uncharacterized protein n=1 Tax=Jatrophihabitans lederbergiae TaxID=3075547 RepID=A0ABU2JET8_9ACTN|nr:hypothetical protein [Jatrophihabitans sp. DSM 44399]MDT0263515.1 hypothetical protein [Jatrophihabitans sp. DSM 44399]
MTVEHPVSGAGGGVDAHRGRSTARALLGVLLVVALTAGAGVALAEGPAPGRQFVVPAAGRVPVLGDSTPGATALLRPEESRPGIGQTGVRGQTGVPPCGQEPPPAR